MTTRVNSDKQIEIIENGKVIAIEKCKRKRRKNGTVTIKLPKNLQVVLNRHGETVLIPTGVKYPYSEEIADAIIMLIQEGCTLKQISEIREMPPLSIIYRWARKYPDFKDGLKDARAERAESYHDKAIEIAQDGDGGKKDKLHVDTLKWAAEKGDPEGYSGKTEQGDITVNIMVDTGINRGEKEVPCEVTVKPVEEKPDVQ